MNWFDNVSSDCDQPIAPARLMQGHWRHRLHAYAEPALGDGGDFASLIKALDDDAPLLRVALCAACDDHEFHTQRPPFADDMTMQNARCNGVEIFARNFDNIRMADALDQQDNHQHHLHLPHHYQMILFHLHHPHQRQDTELMLHQSEHSMSQC